MGIKGTEVSKEAADMVLADDNFASITAAVREGRTVYNNIEKAILFMLPTNGGQALTILAAIFLGLTLTSASRMAVFLYTAPCFTALGLHWFVDGERMRRIQWLGIFVAFAGMTLAFADGFLHGATASGSTLGAVAGDALGVLAGIAWAATTVVVRATRLAQSSASKTLFYQLAVSAVVLLALALGLGEARVDTVTPLAVASLAYQAIVVAFVSYLVWFWLLTRYVASRLSVFSFLTPLFGVTFGVLLLGESFSLRFLLAAALVLTGIALVNAPGKRA